MFVIYIFFFFFHSFYKLLIFYVILPYRYNLISLLYWDELVLVDMLEHFIEFLDFFEIYSSHRIASLKIINFKKNLNNYLIMRWTGWLKNKFVWEKIKTFSWSIDTTNNSFWIEKCFPVRERFVINFAFLIRLLCLR